MKLRLLAFSAAVAVSLAGPALATDTTPPPPHQAGASTEPGACNACIVTAKGERVCYPVSCTSLPNPAMKGGVNRTCGADFVPPPGLKWCYAPTGARPPLTLFRGAAKPAH